MSKLNNLLQERLNLLRSYRFCDESEIDNHMLDLDENMERIDNLIFDFIDNTIKSSGVETLLTYKGNE